MPYPGCPVPPIADRCKVMRATLPVSVFLLLLACRGERPAATVRRAAASADTTFAGVQSRGQVAMGVDQYTSTHIFEPLADGGRIELQRDDQDSIGTIQIQQHLRQIAASFAAGDFRLPGFVHARIVPGAGVMAARRAEISYAIEDLPRGAALRLRSASPAVVRAIHDFLRFQRQDHHAAAHQDS
jgi:hypothetical protein